MNRNTLLKQVIVVLLLPKVLSLLILAAKAIAIAMTGNAYFPASAAKVIKLTADIAILEEAVLGCRIQPRTSTIEARDVALKIVKSDLRSLRNDVQDVADQDPENAEAIAASAAMSVKRSSTGSRRYNSAWNGIETGTIELIGQGAGAHDWQMSLDGIEWTPLESTKISTTLIRNLKSGAVYFFQNRMMLSYSRKSEWSQSVRIRVA